MCSCMWAGPMLDTDGLLQLPKRALLCGIKRPLAPTNKSLQFDFHSPIGWSLRNFPLGIQILVSILINPYLIPTRQGLLVEHHNMWVHALVFRFSSSINTVCAEDAKGGSLCIVDEFNQSCDNSPNHPHWSGNKYVPVCCASGP